MLKISHRGNINGPDTDNENKPEHILKVLANYDCEVDVWADKGRFFLGHDKPQYDIDFTFLTIPGLWCHAKNLEALYRLIKFPDIIVFYHDVDNFTLTSNKFIWTYPDKQTSPNSIIVDTSKDWFSKKYNCFGVCVDYINEYHTILI
jgi:hypothetical protein